MAGKYQHSPQKKVIKRNRVQGRHYITTTAEPLNHEQGRIQNWLKQVRFKQTVIGGVDEADVWKKIAELNSLYEAALSAERARYDALLAERTGSAEQGKAGDETYE